MPLVNKQKSLSETNLFKDPFNGKHRYARSDEGSLIPFLGLFGGTQTVERKPGGAEFGRMMQVSRVKGEDRKPVTFIDKFVSTPGEKRNYPAIDEKVFLDFYKSFSRAASSRLGLISKKELKQIIDLHIIIEDPVLKKDVVEDTYRGFLKSNIIDDGSDENRLIFRSKRVEAYQDFGQEFVDYIHANSHPRETVLVEGQERTIKGLMAIAAVAKILGDNDWLGGSGKNTGFTLGDDGSLNAIIVDAGNSLRCAAINDLDCQFMVTGEKINFSNLTVTQKDEYLETLRELSELTEDDIFQWVYRDGLWNCQLEEVQSDEISVLDLHATPIPLYEPGNDESISSVVLMDEAHALNITQAIFTNVTAVKALLIDYDDQHQASIAPC